MFIPLAAVPSGERATRPACVIFCSSVLPSGVCCSRPACVIRAPFGSSIIPSSCMCVTLSLPLDPSRPTSTTSPASGLRVTAGCCCGSCVDCALVAGTQTLWLHILRTFASPSRQNRSLSPTTV
uniref:Putative secreted protein n=1 Tax=Anopheles triannulatus TaxID=58253 RepID=A0A2M4B137_9DIPT